MGLAVPEVTVRGPSASAVILAEREAERFRFEGLADALAVEGGTVDVRLFGKPVTRPYRRMGVALARAGTTDAARALAAEAASRIRITDL
jgi:phosphoribosylglycinamide formyltransferase 2